MYSFPRYSVLLLQVCTCLCLLGCGGTKLLNEVQPIDIEEPLISRSDTVLSAHLLAVIVRDGPGTWARKADWDEYLISITNISESDIQVTNIELTDSLGVRMENSSDRKELVNESKNTVRRYKGSGLNVTSGIGTATLITTGAAVVVVGTAAAAAAAPAAILGGATTVGMAPAMVAGAVLLSPVFAVAGLRRLSNGKKVSAAIAERSTLLPLQILPGEEILLDQFYPLAPSPLAIEITYTVAGEENIVVLDTSDVLNGLHLVQ